MATKKFLVIVTFQSNNKTHMAQQMTKINTKLKALVGERNIIALHGDRSSFSLVVASDQPAHVIRTRIDGNATVNHGNPQANTGLENGDRIIVLELGQETSENGFKTAVAFLQHR